MAIISGVNIPDNMLVEVALTSIFGVGNYQAKIIVEKSGIKLNSVRVKDLSDEELGTIRSNVDSSNLVIEGDLKREIQLNVRRLGDIKSYRGNRHRLGLPARGQRTKTNARTKRGKRSTVAGRKQVPTH
jgi:small subunit ribosomal protein S13|tara:strand:+ start:3266 stop:3652 length:387 start_codon:yes stop_codon:yes gene_type:complete